MCLLEPAIVSGTERADSEQDLEVQRGEVAVSCPLLRDTVNAAEPTKFEASLWSRARVAACGVHTLCVSEGGGVFALGANTKGQLGVGDTENRVVPTLVTGLLKTKTVVQVAAGYRHSACLTADGLVYVCGKGDQGRLGVGDTEDKHAPTLVTGLQGKRVVHVAAGEYHTICSTSDGSVFTWGAGDVGQLGLGDESDVLQPTLVRGELQGKQVVQVAAGDYHSACVIGDGSV